MCWGGVGFYLGVRGFVVVVGVGLFEDADCDGHVGDLLVVLVVDVCVEG